MKKQNQVQTQHVIGVDLHSNSFSAVLTIGSSLGNMEVVRNFTKLSTADWEFFITQQIPARSTIVCEAGCNSFELMKAARGCQHKTVVLSSIKVGQIARAYCKNDAKDALRAAKVYLCGLADENVWIPDESTTIRREILSAYSNAITDCTRCVNRIKSFLTEHNIRYRQKINNREKVYQQVAAQYAWSPEQLFLLKEMFQDLSVTSAKRDRLFEVIWQTVLSNENMAKLMNLCGIRLKAAYALMAAIGDIERFASPKALVAYIELAPCVEARGNKNVSRGIQCGGKKEVKAILIQGAQSVLKSKNASGEALRKWGCALMMRRGKNVAMAGIARKLTGAVWYALKGFLPEILEAEQDIRIKTKKIAEELTLNGVKKLGYKKVMDFVDEYTILLLSRNPEVGEHWKQKENHVSQLLRA